MTTPAQAAAPAAAPAATPSPATVPGTPEYVAAMAARYDAAQTPAGNAPQPYIAPAAPAAAPARPANVPEKFWDAATGQINNDALLKSYTDLERAHSGAAAPAPEPKPGTVPPNTGTVPVAGGPSQVDWNAAVGEFVRSGEFAAETLVKFSKAGVPPEALREFAVQRKAALEQNVKETSEYAKGTHGIEFNSVLEWGRANLDASEAQAFNALLNSPKGWKTGVDALVTRMRNALPGAGEPKAQLLGSGANAPAAGGPYASPAQQSADINNPLYRSDPAFRAQVHARIAISKF